MNRFGRAEGQVTWGGRPFGADPATFEDLGGDFGRDATRAWFGSTPIEGADPATFRHLVGRWTADALRIYFRDARVIGADRASFEVFDDVWARDRSRAFRVGRLIVGADAARFRPLNRLYASDGAKVWTLGGELKGVEAAAFRVLDPAWDPTLGLSYGYGTDGQTLWYYAETIGKPRAVPGAVASLARVLAHAWCTDGTSVWHEGHRIADADPASFEPLGMWWARDVRRAYYGSHGVRGADPATLEIEHAGAIRARDARGLYVRGGSASPAEWEAAQIRPARLS